MLNEVVAAPLRNVEGAASVMKRPRTGTPNMTTKKKMNQKLNIAMMKVTLVYKLFVSSEYLLTSGKVYFSRSAIQA
jgi:hypothetical protein